MTDDAKIFAGLADHELAFEYLLARLRIEAGKTAALLLSAATEHAKEHGNGDTWTIAAVEASESLADIAAHGLHVEDEDDRARRVP